jgi:hypothetical protein
MRTFGQRYIEGHSLARMKAEREGISEPAREKRTVPTSNR